MDRYSPTRHTALFDTRLPPGAMAQSANGNPGKHRRGRNRDSFLSNAHAREALP